ncbi:MAG: EAL domain-containing protein [Acidimicrobiia bacterium]
MVSRRHFWQIAGGFALAVALFAALLVGKFGGPRTTRAVDDLSTVAAALVAGITASLAAARRSRAHRLGWLLLAVGSWMWAFAEGVWAWYSLRTGTVPVPSVADLGYLGAVPLVVAAVVAFPSGIPLTTRTRALLDGGIVCAGLLLLSWASVLGPAFRAGGATVLEQTVSLGYPAGDVITIAVVLAMLGHRQRPADSPLAWVGAGVLLMAVADSAYAWLVQTNSYADGKPIDAMWVAGYLLIALAALRPDPLDTAADTVDDSIPLGRLLLPYVVAAAAIAVLMATQVLRGSVEPFLFWIGIVLFVLVAVRQLLTLVDNRALNRRLHRNIAALGTRERQLAHLALHDSLTNLANRKLFQDRLAHALEQRLRRPAPLGVLFVDVDDFKTINDSLGHEVGDRLLVTVADRLRACVRAGDTVARLGGDEFGVLSEDDTTDVTGLAFLAARLLDAVSAPMPMDGQDIRVRASVGITWSEFGREPWDQLLREADLAMYAAKAKGKGCYEVFAPSMAVQASERLDLKGALDLALARGEMSIRYQPIVDLASGRVCGAEALTRWNHPQRGEIPPGVFIPLAEETGRIVDLGRWALREACTQAGRWQPSREPFVMSVNLSAVELGTGRLVNDVSEVLTEFGLDPSCLMLEITESMLMRDTERTLDQLRELRGLGVKLAIDDFGTGYSSLSYLPRFPVDVIKIDRAFVKNICDAAGGSTLAQTIVDLARRLTLHTIAEGVENEEQADALFAIGCEAAQGWWFAADEPASRLPRPGTVLRAPRASRAFRASRAAAIPRSRGAWR